LLLPLRVFVALILIFWYWSIVKIGCINHKDFANKPLARWRRNYVISIAQPMARVLMFILGFYNIKKKGSNKKYDSKGGSNLIVVNHSSWLDIFLLMATTDDLPGFVAKREVINIPFIGFCSLAWGCLYVDNRAKPSSSNESHSTKSGDTPVVTLTTLLSQRAQRLDMPPIVCFPEGTTTNGKYLIQFRTGAFVGGHAVKPVAIRYLSKHFSPIWESIGGVSHILRMLTQFRIDCEIEYLPNYYPNEEEKKDPKFYADNVRKVIASALHVPTTESSFADKVVYHQQYLGWTQKKKTQ